MKKKKWWLALSMLCIAAVLMAGCSNTKDDGNSGTDVQAKLDPVTLKIMIPGDRPPGMDEIIKEAEKRMDGNLNVKLDIVFIPFADLKQKTQVVLASAENVDLIFDAPWVHINEMIAAGSYEPLDDLLQEHGQSILASRPKEMWDANKFQGKIYGIPLGAYHLQGKGYIIRKDIREKLGIDPIQSFEDLLNFLKAVKEKEQNIIPFTPAPSYGMTASTHQLNFDYETQIRRANVGDSYVLYYKNNDGIVYNLFDEMEPKVGDLFDTARDLFNAGIINQDIMAIKSEKDLFKNGKTAVITANDFGVPSNIANDLEKNITGAEAEYITFFDQSKQKIADFKQANFISVPKVSENKERAIQFLEWTQQKENYDLLAYGIEGKHWEAVGDDQYKPLEEVYPFFAFAWIWNPTMNRLDANQSDEINSWNKWTQDSSNFTTDIITGFSFDSAPVNNELAQFNALSATYFKAIAHGALDPKENWEEYKKEAAPFAKAMQEELQKQVNEFFGNKQ
jgi:putative aldouronate transport system substrate-binding protein